MDTAGLLTSTDPGPGAGRRCPISAWQSRGPSQGQIRAPSPGGQVSEMGRRAAGQQDSEGQRVRAISSTSQRA
jgi:hypothetical protein